VRVAQAAHRVLTKKREQQPRAGATLLENARRCGSAAHLESHDNTITSLIIEGNILSRSLHRYIEQVLAAAANH
jgi:hypothetical protein